MNPLLIIQKAVAGFALSVILLLSVLLVISKGEARHWKKAAESCASARAIEQRDVRLKTAQAQLADAKHVADVNASRAKVSEEKADDYQTKLADLKRRYDAERVRGRAESGAVASGGGGAAVPELPGAAGGADGGAASSENDFNCAANTLQLGALIDWVRAQAAIPN